MRKKGFTLTELLAVIVVLALIALIATPIVINVVEKSRKEAAEVSMEQIEKTAELYFNAQQLIGEASAITFKCSNGVCKSGEEILKISGKSPDFGTITINTNGEVTMNSIVINGFLCVKKDEEYSCSRTKLKETSTTNGVITLNDGSNSKLNNYKIYGNSVQLGTPSPNNLVQIESVGNNITNLFNMSQYKGNAVYSSINTTNEYIAIIGENTNDPHIKPSGISLQNINKYYALEVEPNTMYNLSWDTSWNEDLTDLFNYANKVYIHYYDENLSEIGSIKAHNRINTHTSRTFKTPENTKYVFVRFGYELSQTLESSEVIYSKVALIKSDQEQGYSPYGISSYKIPIKVSSKNLFDYSNRDMRVGYDVANASLIEELENGVILQGNNGNDTGNGAHANGWFGPGGSNCGQYYTGIYLKAGSVVTISADYTVLEKHSANYGKTNILLYGRDINNKQVTGKGGREFNQPELNTKTRVYQTVSIETDGMYYPIFALNSNKVKIENIQIEYGSTATAYVPHQEKNYVIDLKEPLRKVGASADYIDFASGKIVRNVKVVDNSGTLPLADSLVGLETSSYTDIKLPNIELFEGYNNITIGTTINPSEFSISYYNK